MKFVFHGASHPAFAGQVISMTGCHQHQQLLGLLAAAHRSTAGTDDMPEGEHKW